ncbi:MULTISPECIES: DUF2997 domain-containing protein [Bacillus]|jgi:hypothetical protein|uniref:DUF2997 domain-containing protein n=1 Tax=Bacillus thuringiensis TaxID=1428 RepID=A0A9X6WR48_BACTU|nr:MULTISPECIES: DUF2997 domain-containing protein [Bacillus]MDR4323533.1 DUF2997 domain-containing protein [Bacillus paranthracis]ANV74510.1 hypothetical protein BCM43_29195 [Bacillus thuringiensis]EJQ86812.1 hypothetical protein IGW_05350 [Bacillus cereus ISP3191]MCU7756669.1 DUF2997 domain-containing protein [Bacillus cereus]MDA2627492.1 DUF2997 domain-containing protein [Bacillus cereus]
MEKRVKIRILPDGTVQAETKGIKGEKCTDYILILEELLQAEAIEAQYTEEFYETEQIQQIQGYTLVSRSGSNNIE